MSVQKAQVEAYLSALQELQESRHTTEELSFHSPLHNLLRAFAIVHSVVIVHEPAQRAYGRPDFIFLRNEIPLGYLEVETYGTDLDKLSGEAKLQNERFIQNLDNFILTNCLEFRLYREGQLVARALLSRPPERGKVILADAEFEALANLLEAFFTAKPAPIADPQTLAYHLARRTCQLAVVTEQLLRAETDTELHSLHRAFEQVLLPELSYREFADMFAQTVAYGMFSARIGAPQKPTFTRQDAFSLIPATNRFLRRLFQQVSVDELDPTIAWIADEIAGLLAQADMLAILQDFGKRRGREDPVVHFYEDFLQAYNPQLRELRGVYYTPEPVVGYIVRSVDEILRQRFDKPDGLANKDALLLDPACGTGSFLFAVVERLHESFRQRGQEGLWESYLNEQLLDKLHGFELLVAPYTIAHLKLGLQLEQLGWKPQRGQRLGIYLTNALERPVRKTEILLGEYISREANEAVEIKRKKPILVVFGNPPYSGHSANRSVVATEGKRELTWIGRLIEDYKRVDGKPLGERNPKWLQDDYAKFIRFAEWRIEQTGQGIVAFITNHAYLDNPTFRGMRQHLMQTFDEIYLLNLHGNARKKERAPDGSPDENVFDIQQGVAILLAVKLPPEKRTEPCKVHYADLWGTRKTKYRWLDDHSWATTEWTPLQPTSPFYWFIPDASGVIAQEYEAGWRIPDIFSLGSVGIATARDKLTVQFTPDAVWETVKEFVSLEPETARARFRLPKDVRDWKVSLAQDDLRRAGVPDISAKQQIVPIHYRPFDVRYTFYTGISRGFHCMPRNEVMRHFFRPNIGLIVGRAGAVIGDPEWNVAFVTQHISDLNIFRRGGGAVYPLYLYREFIAQNGLYDEGERQANLNPEFLQALLVDATPERVLAYLYAVLYCPTYRARYREFLMRDFPRIPLPPSPEAFDALAQLGQQLIDLHTLSTPSLADHPFKFPVAGSNQVDEVRYGGERVWINEKQYFEPVPLEVWEFRVGGYAVAKKWLTERKALHLSYDDLNSYLRLLEAVRQTLALMETIDSVWSEHFPV